MQTFLAYSDFNRSAQALDNLRLGNQCYRECLTLLNGGWKHHPVAKMWAKYKGALCLYALALVTEMEKRDRWKPEVITRWKTYYTKELTKYDKTMPSWLGDEHFHASHRSNLLRKDPIHYGQFGWTEPDNLPYIWPN